jgi:transaldolase
MRSRPQDLRAATAALPEEEAFFEHGEVGDPLPADGGDADAMLARFTEAGVDLGEVAARLQRDGATSFVTAWNELTDQIKVQASMVT